jgi:hypothetical protein
MVMKGGAPFIVKDELNATAPDRHNWNTNSLPARSQTKRSSESDDLSLQVFLVGACRRRCLQLWGG